MTNGATSVRARLGRGAALAASLLLLPACPAPVTYDVILRGGTIYDGGGAPPYTGDVAIQGDAIAAIGILEKARGEVEVDASGLAVAPGFINVLSWATESLIEDGRSQSDIRQGVTLEVFGEGWSLGPVNDTMRYEQTEQQGDIKYDITWTTLAEALETIAARGISPNIASFVGAASVRIHELAHEDRRPTRGELERMRALVDAAMRGGALGLGSALIYAPATYADTDELVALAAGAGRHGGMSISHMRSEGNRLLEAVDEVVEIARRAKLPAEIYHLKQAGRSNWSKLDAVIDRVTRARAEGLAITADMYPYDAGATGLSSCFPLWAHEGGLRATLARLRDVEQRGRI
ncbi:MAG: N-acyl-D-amino-acid deacylase family protein, partial [Myxococcota bacterium]